jgi:hypothetical protein
MNLIKERSCAEIILFAAAVFGIWLFVWSIILTNVWLGVVAGLTTLVSLVIFALLDD